jgi:hypothetical protein
LLSDRFIYHTYFKTNLPLQTTTTNIKMAQPKSRVPLAVGLTAAAGVGYYLYQSGGNAKVAEKKFEGKPARHPLPRPSCSQTGDQMTAC